MSARQSVKILHGALDEVGEGKSRDIVLRGVLDPDSLGLILTDDYQREILSGSSFDGLVDAFQNNGKVPDVVLAMRGGDFTDRQGTFFLQNEVYVVDGLQRVSAARTALQDKPDTMIRLGATVYFGTTMEWERKQFRVLNANRVKVSPNVLLRNMKDDFPVVAAVFSLCEDRSFILRDRVCWGQRQRRSDLIHALVLLKTIGRLHGHIGPGRSTKIQELIPGLQTIMERAGRNTFRDNIRTFFEVVDECWGLRSVVYRGSTHLRGGFLRALARLFTTHNKVFFKGERFVVDVDTRRKLKTFPTSDPQVIQLASSGGQSADILYQLILEHVNRGRRTNRLVESVDVISSSMSETEADLEEEAEEAGE